MTGTLEQTDWAHQTQGVADATELLGSGRQRILLTSPTGGGKTLMMVRLIQWARDNFRAVALYTNRRMLLDQTREYLENHNVDVGMRAAGHDRGLLRSVQLCMVQSEYSAVYRYGRHELADAALVLIDEAHVNTGETIQTIMADHVAKQADVVGFTATPLGLGELYDHLIVAGRTHQLQQDGILVRARTYAPDEPDLRKLKSVTRDYSETEQRKLINPAVIIGRVWDHWQRLNPTQEPTVLFAGGVPEAIYFAQQFYERGVPSASVSGDRIWWNGHEYDNTDEMRQQIRLASENGDLPVITNRFVYREGVNYPWLRHGILACVFGSVGSYIQAGGRLLRQYDGKSDAIIQDHGGNWHRHGSLNENRDWFLDATDSQAQLQRRDAMRAGTAKEPVTCPRCGRVSYQYQRACVECGFRIKRRQRMVWQTDDTLSEKLGRIYPPIRRRQDAGTATKWERIYWRGWNSRNGMTFSQAEGLFVKEHHYWPPRDLPLMPTEPDSWDWHRRIRAVSRGRLR